MLALAPLTLVTPASAATLTSTSYTASNTLTGTAGARNDWGFTTATTATLSKVTMGMPTGTSGGNRYLALSGAATNYAYTSDSTFNSITGNIDIRAQIAPASWTPASYQRVLAKWNSPNYSYDLELGSSGNLSFCWSTDGSNQLCASGSTATGFAAQSTHWIRVAFQPNNGSSGNTATFYTSSDGTNWTALGSPVVQAGTTTIYDGNSPVFIGSSAYGANGLLIGKVYYADVRNSIGANGVASNCSSAGVVNCFNPNNDTIAGTGWNSASANAEPWAINQSGTNLPADIASDLSVAKVTGLPVGGTANYRSIDRVATYNLPTATSVPSGTAISLGLMGLTNTSTAGSYTSAITTYDNSATPAAIDTATTAALTITGNTISTAFGATPDYTTATAAASVTAAIPVGAAIYGTTMYVADAYTNVVLSVNMTTGMATRYAGTSGVPNYSGDGGLATSATLNNPKRLAVDTSGNLYIADYGNNRIRKVTLSTGYISTVAGNGTNGSAGDGAAATSANVNPQGVGVASNGDIYIADTGNSKVRKVDHTTGYISTVAGTGASGYSGDGGPATSAKLSTPVAINFDSNGDVYISDYANAEIRKLTLSSGNISSFVGNGTCAYSGDGAAASAAQICSPDGVAFASNGDAYIVDGPNDRVRKITAATGFISTLAGNGTAAYGGDGGSATSGLLNAPGNPVLDSSGNLYFTDNGNSRVREISTGGTISTYLGTGLDTDAGDGGQASAAMLYGPSQLAPDSSGNLYLVDSGNNRVRKIDQWGTITTFIGQPDSRLISGSSGNGAAAAAAKLNSPSGVAVTANGDVYVADNGNNVIRKVDHTTGYISSFVSVSSPSRLAVNPVTGDLYTIKSSTCQVVKITMAGVQSTFAGNGTCGFNVSSAADPTTVAINNPRDLAFSAAGDLYITALNNNTILKVDAVTGALSTIAGGGASIANNVAATATLMTAPRSLAVDALGNIYEDEDGGHYDVRRFVDGGAIQKIAGSGSTGNSGDGGAATAASFLNTNYLAILRGQLYIVQNKTNTIRKVADIAPMAPNVNADSMSVAMNTPLTYPVESNDWDQDGAIDPNSVAINTSPAHGTAVVNTVQGSITNVTYTPTTSYTGADSFVYQACDSTLVLCNTATVTVTVGSNQVTTVLGGLTEGLGSNIGFAPARGVRFKNYIFYSDVNLNVIRRYDIYSQQSVVVAGNGTPGSTNGTGQSASFSTPKGLAIAPSGQLYIADNGNSLVRTLNTDGTVSSLSVGVTTPLGLTFGITGTLYAATGNTVKSWNGSSWANFAGTGVTGTSGDGGAATSALLSAPGGLSTAPNGDVYISDGSSCTVRKVNLAGMISAVAGQAGSCSFSGDGGTATSATLNNPVGITIDSTGALLISEYNDSKIRKVDTSGNITSVTITGTAPSGPVDVVAGTSTDFYVFNTGSNRGLYVSTSSVGTTVLGNGYGSYAGDGLAPLATQFSEGSSGAALAVDSLGDIYAAEGNGGTGPRSAIRESTVATGLVSSPVTSANANGFAFDGSGNLVYADYSACRVYRLNSNLSTTVLAGTGTCSTSGDGGTATAATLNHPSGLAYDAAGNFYVSEYSSNVIRRVTPGGIISTVAGTGTAGLSGDGAIATAAQLNTPTALAVDRNGNLLVVDSGNSRVRLVDTKGEISTFAGTSSGFSGDGGLATAAKLSVLRGIAVDSANNVFIADQSDRIRKVDSSGVITTVAGSGTSGFVDNATYLAAVFNGTGGIALDNAGNLYISEVSNHRVRKAAALASTATDNVASASWSVVPGASGHTNLREQFMVTPSATTTSSKLTFTLPPSAAGTPSVVSAYGVTGTVTPSLSGTTLTLSYPSQTLSAGVPISFAVEGWTNGGSNGAYNSNVTMYDSAGSTAIGWARSNVVNISASGGPASTDPGYSSVWMPSTTVTSSASPISISVNPANTPTASGSTTITTGGNLNGNSIGLGATTLTRTATPFSTFSPVSAGIGTGVAAGSFGADTWGSSASTTTGSVQGGATSGNFVGNTASQQTFVSGASATNTYTFTAQAKVDWLLPAGTYTSTLTYGLSPGT